MRNFAGKIAVVTGGGTGMGRELAKQLAAEGCHVAMCDVSAEHMEETQAACRKLAPPGTRVTTHLCDVSDERQVLRLPRRGRGGPRDQVHPSALQQRRHRRRRQHAGRRARGVGQDLRRLLGRRLLLHARLPAAAGREPRRPPDQHEQRERLLGEPRPEHPPHRLQRREVRGEGLQRGADRRPARERAAREGVGRDARPRRHLDHREQRRRARPAEPEGDERRGPRAGARAPRRARASPSTARATTSSARASR